MDFLCFPLVCFLLAYYLYDTVIREEPQIDKQGGGSHAKISQNITINADEFSHEDRERIIKMVEDTIKQHENKKLW